MFACMHSDPETSQGEGLELPAPRSNAADAYAPLRVLSLTGGGFRGLFTARTLVTLCRQARREGPLDGCFDVFAGTSIGGLMACALAVGVPPMRVLDAIDAHGPRVFRKPAGASIRRLFFGALYDADNLAKAIRDCLGAHANTRLSALERGLLVPAVDWLAGELQVFRSAWFGRARTSDATLLEVCLATSAAPTYFDAAQIDGKPMLDGGLAANNPDALALLEILRRFPAAAARIEMLSLGTAGFAATRQASQARRSALGWAPDLPNCMIDLQERSAARQAQALLGTRYRRINHPGDASEAFTTLDTADAGARDRLLRAADEAAAAAYRQDGVFVDRMLSASRA
ncbi:hypothetical protein RGE_07240 [Rubrivivax gelatinosus IL144]|uniref:PNPLA domain-containing protein n=2 Tax=Rubrivivax gelatinosus TaxID=28068 RepID=I0HM30_RUBGI|nr:hypothetical protein RGE_07240 [Rubrivivax gelatinosus IL144]